MKKKKKINFNKIWKESKGTLYIIALFMLITTGLPMIVKSQTVQVITYLVLAATLAFDIGAN